MSDKQIRISKVDKAQYINYWKKAREFFTTMQTSLAHNNWNAAALNAIHAGISANDALLVCFHGVRSCSPKHDDAVKLLLSLVRHERTKANSTHLRKLIGKKDIAEYEGRLFTRLEAQALAKHAQRFLEWVESILPR